MSGGVRNQRGRLLFLLLGRDTSGVRSFLRRTDSPESVTVERAQCGETYHGQSFFQEV